jgi:tetratricopeptide (TPR) repeat protein
MDTNVLAKYVLICAALWSGVVPQIPEPKVKEDELAPRVEEARVRRDDAQLNSLKTEFEKRVKGNNCSARCLYEQARVQLYLADLYDLRKDKKAAAAATDHGIEVALHSLQVDDKSADTQALLGDLYAHRITYGVAMFAGPKYGPKINDEIARGMSLDDKNPRVWATQGRKFLMAPKMFGGDIDKAIESLKKSLELDDKQAETWSWLARAYKKQGDIAKTKEAIQKAQQLEPENPMVKLAVDEISK